MKKIIVKYGCVYEYESKTLFGKHLYWRKIPTDQDPKHIKLVQDLDRNKMLDEGVFLAICGLNMCREKMFITGVVRLEMAHHKIGKAIDYIYKERDKKLKKAEEDGTESD